MYNYTSDASVEITSIGFEENGATFNYTKSKNEPALETYVDDNGTNLSRVGFNPNASTTYNAPFVYNGNVPEGIQNSVEFDMRNDPLSDTVIALARINHDETVMHNTALTHLQ